MLKIGLTGGIASGKSVVASRLRELGAVLVDADALAREVVEPGTPGLARVVDAFGAEVLSADGGLDRPRLGAVVFGNPDRLAVLNGIIHPLVRERAAALLAAAQVRPREAPSWSRTSRCWWRPGRGAASIWSWWWTLRTPCACSAWWTTAT